MREKGLQHILYRAGIIATEGPLDRRVDHLSIDSRQLGPSSLFAALPGTRTDGHAFIPAAIAGGAGVILCERMPETRPAGITFIQVNDARKALGSIASNFYDHPSASLQLVGVTGTNGKTTTASLLYQVFRS
ncbi:MAG TPA: Mur ligase domain-containing protein, partial [Bacteroidales bacterium]|nr:Mur ligase domain-containing protein [Bacteroidales bacterium]